MHKGFLSLYGLLELDWSHSLPLDEHFAIPVLPTIFFLIAYVSCNSVFWDSDNNVEIMVQQGIV